ncbi:isopentenyltransferase 9 [Tasmannia lanceolata]|uniref:isopentenyltransferase 9 n=1 Tax=Tasmannia lanceolata TaxID=3420 RepID=UPI004062E8D1
MSSVSSLRLWGLSLAPRMHPWNLTTISALQIPPHLYRPKLTLTFCSISDPYNIEKKQKKKVIVISGPTGAGKTRLALELAKRLNGEIISADSVQVYRGLDIGSAKPSPRDRKEVPHHLLDILDPSEDYSVGQFFHDARQATRDILDNGHVPIVTGGTGLYLRWYIYGKPEVPKASSKIDSEVSSELMCLQRNEDWDAAVQLVTEAGDPRAQFLARNDWYRLRRSLEIIKSSGSPPSAFRVPYDSFREQLDSRISDPSYDDKSSTVGIGEKLSEDLEYDFFCFFLSSQRVALYRHIDLRCEEMLTGSQGILSEAAGLLEMGLLPNMNSATRAIGYRQAMEFLLKCREQGGRSSAGEFNYFLSDFQKASRNFAKRQLTWFRNEHIYQWLDAAQPLEKVLDFILDAYRNETGKVVVPESLRMEKDVTSRQETYELKSYRTKNRYFVRHEDCSLVLDWVRKTQGQLNSAFS